MNPPALHFISQLADLIAPQTPTVAQKHPLIIAGIIVAAVIVISLLALRAIRKKP